jgi:hypothetical protein
VVTVLIAAALHRWVRRAVRRLPAVRERMIDFLQREHPGALPRRRAEVALAAKRYHQAARRYLDPTFRLNSQARAAPSPSAKPWPPPLRSCGCFENQRLPLAQCARRPGVIPARRTKTVARGHIAFPDFTAFFSRRRRF